jgi:hypothetical protein
VVHAFVVNLVAVFSRTGSPPNAVKAIDLCSKWSIFARYLEKWGVRGLV